MNFTLSITDLLLCGAATLLVLTIILLVKRIDAKNYVFVTALSLYFTMIIATCCCIIFLHHKPASSNTIYIPVIFALVLSAHNVFHYLCIQHLTLKTNLFKVTNLIHFAPIILIVVLMLLFNPVYTSKSSNLISVFETQNLASSHNNNYIVVIFRILHPLLYLSLGGKLIYSFYKTTLISAETKAIRRFVYFIYLQKIILMLFFVFGLIGVDNNFELFSNIAITAYSLSAFLTSTYVLLNPNLSMQLTRLNFLRSKTIEDNALDDGTKYTPIREYNVNPITKKKEKLLPVFFSKEYELEIETMTQNWIAEKKYLDTNSSLISLSIDTNIPVHHLSYFFNVILNTKYTDWRNALRIEHARNQIDEGFTKSSTLEALRIESGFATQSTFINCFKNVFGCTPSEYIKKQKN